MAAISKVLRDYVDGTGQEGLMFHCPGCNIRHKIYVGVGKGPQWSWNRDVNKPTFGPSIKVEGHRPITDEEVVRILAGEDLSKETAFLCHSFVIDGKIQFLSDCTHSLANQTVDMVEEWEPGE